MKIRTDFVTNSSSSSFLVAYKTMPEIDSEILKRYPFIKLYPKIVDFVLSSGECSYNETESARLFKSKQHFDDYIVDRYGWSDTSIDDILNDEMYPKDVYDKAINLMENGYSIFQKDIDHNDITLYDTMHCLAEGNDDFIILEGD